MKKLISVGVVVFFVATLLAPVIAQAQQAPAAKVEPKGTEGPDVRKQAAQGHRGSRRPEGHQEDRRLAGTAEGAAQGDGGPGCPQARA